MNWHRHQEAHGLSLAEMHTGPRRSQLTSCELDASARYVGSNRPTRYFDASLAGGATWERQGGAVAVVSRAIRSWLTRVLAVASQNPRRNADDAQFSRRQAHGNWGTDSNAPFLQHR